jgi:cystathionine beta-lyase/cystathionine gamma-synthase
MEKRIYGQEFGFATRAVHTGNDGETGAIRRPVTMANSYALPYDPSEMNWSGADKSLYTRNGGSNQKYLEEKLAALSGGEDCVVLASGVAALSGLLFCPPQNRGPRGVFQRNLYRRSVTLPLRMRQHNENALQIARYLESLPRIRFTAYPGLESHQGHAVAASQMSPGFGGVLAFGLDADHDTHNRFVSHLRLITSAVSLGHDESLIVFLGEKDERQYLYPPEFHGGFFRFSVGLEDGEDIIADLDQALKKTGLR